MIFIYRQRTNKQIRLKLLIGCTNRTDWHTYYHITLDPELPFLYFIISCMFYTKKCNYFSRGKRKMYIFVLDSLKRGIFDFKVKLQGLIAGMGTVFEYWMVYICWKYAITVISIHIFGFYLSIKFLWPGSALNKQRFSIMLMLCF